MRSTGRRTVDAPLREGALRPLRRGQGPSGGFESTRLGGAGPEVGVPGDEVPLRFKTRIRLQLKQNVQNLQVGDSVQHVLELGQPDFPAAVNFY
ncbi:hypothetical protein DIPPA_14826 [Diplonema papillatum]|nr:hypothetical protein DIPPA_14826 [Diplonema papillatum]